MTLHILFTPSAAGDLRETLRHLGRDDRVICLFDCLSFGPINPPDPAARQKWIEDELGYTGWEEVTDKSEAFWTDALSSSERKIAWTSRRSAQEFAGFLEWLWRFGDGPLEVIDLTDVSVVSGMRDGVVTKPHPAVSVALLSTYQLLENGLLDRAVALTPTLRDRYRAQWRQLRIEDAPLRVLTPEGLASAPLTFFDPTLLSYATPAWQKMAMVVAKALSEFWDTGLIQTGDLVLAARVRALVESGDLEARGDLSEIRWCEVRLPPDGTPRQGILI
jgi:hypothetical protein